MLILKEGFEVESIKKKYKIPTKIKSKKTCSLRRMSFINSLIGITDLDCSRFRKFSSLKKMLLIRQNLNVKCAKKMTDVNKFIRVGSLTLTWKRVHHLDRSVIELIIRVSCDLQRQFSVKLKQLNKGSRKWPKVWFQKKLNHLFLRVKRAKHSLNWWIVSDNIF